MRVVSTGGTARHLKEAGIQVVDVSEQTGSPEVMDGRVKTLHPRVHMGLLARAHVASDMELLKEQGLEPFDLVLCNLYPFEEALKKDLTEEEQIEFIDIGGPSMLRSAAKSFNRIAVICDPEDYGWVSDKSELTLKDRQFLAAKVYAHTSTYDSMISQYLGADQTFPNLRWEAVMSLPCGTVKILSRLLGGIVWQGPNLGYIRRRLSRASPCRIIIFSI